MGDNGLGWWAISGDAFLDALRRAHNDEAWCAHGGHVHPEPGCPFCPEAPRG